MRIVLCQSCAKTFTNVVKSIIKRDKCQCCGKARLCSVCDVETE